MKKYLTILLCFFLWQCSEDELPFYSGEKNIYFSAVASGTSTPTDNLAFSFGLLNVMDTILKVQVIATGDVANYDRYFDFVIDSITSSGDLMAEKGRHFDVPEQGIIPADSSWGYIPLSLWRIVDDTDIYSIYFRLVENDEFGLKLKEIYYKSDTINALRLKYSFSSSISKPAYWMDAFFGYFSVAKYNLICELCGINASYWNGMPDIGFHQGYASSFAAYVNAQLLNAIDKKDPSLALKDPQNTNAADKGYLTMRGINSFYGAYQKIPEDWPHANE